MDLHEESPPRSDVTVDQWVHASADRIKKVSRAVSVGFYVIGIGCVAFVAVMTLSTGDWSAPTLENNAVMATLALLFMGYVPGLAIRRLLRRDMRATRELVRDGTAYTARILQHGRYASGRGMHRIRVIWREADRDAFAQFDIDKLNGQLREGAETTVLAIRHNKRVAIVVEGDGLFTGLRRRR